jgi:hypothetical protein
MKPLLIRIFTFALLVNSILAFGAASDCKDEKTPACSPPAASTPQSSEDQPANMPQSDEDQHCAQKMKKEKKMKKQAKPTHDDNYPGYGIYG